MGIVRNTLGFFGISTPNRNSSDEGVTAAPQIQRIEPLKTEMTWTGEMRSPKKLNKKAVRNLLVVGVVLGAFAIAIQEFLFVITIALCVFVYYLLIKRQTSAISYELSNYGLRVNGVLYDWPRLRHFFESEEPNTICVDAKTVIPGRIYLYFDTPVQAQAVEFLSNYLAKLEKPPKTFIDNFLDSLFDKIDFQKQ